jgi:hypothetical protein
MNRPITTTTTTTIDVSPDQIPYNSTTAYQVAVQQYFDSHEGCTVEFTFRQWGESQIFKKVRYPSWDWSNFSYRITPDPDPKPELVPLTREDIPPVCWIRADGSKSKDAFLVTQISPTCLYYGVGTAPGCLGATLPYFKATFEDMFEDPEFAYSTDLKNWKPFRKEL